MKERQNKQETGSRVYLHPYKGVQSEENSAAPRDVTDVSKRARSRGGQIAYQTYLSTIERDTAASET